MVFTGLGLNSPAPEFQFYSTNSLKTSPTMQYWFKTSGLMVKRFTTVGDHQRGSQGYMKNRRGRKEIEVSR